jgi:GNAT superfamily N-acetyltransferase
MQPVPSHFFIRMARPDDVDACRKIDVEAWGEESAATAEMLAGRIGTYPFGNYVAIDRANGEIIGTVWTVATDEKPVTTWWEMSGEGAYTGSCNMHGDVLFGINLSVPPAHARKGVGQLLVARVIEAAWIAGRRLAVLGSRIPEYHLWKDRFHVDDYIRLLLGAGRAYYRDPETGVLHEGPTVDQLRAAEGLVDPRTWPLPTTTPAPRDLQVFDGELGFFMDVTVGPHRCKLYKALPGYFPDPDSCDYGVLIGWENQDHPAFDPTKP